MPLGLAYLARDYAGLLKAASQLGPPLPADLGRPIANAGAPAPDTPTRRLARRRSNNDLPRNRERHAPATVLSQIFA